MRSLRLGTADVRLAFAQDDDTLTATGAFAVKYLLLFTKATGLASEVTLSLSTGGAGARVVRGGGGGARVVLVGVTSGGVRGYLKNDLG